MRTLTRMITLLFATALFATSAIASPQRENSLSPDALLISGADADLRQALGTAYPAFARNFTSTAQPVLLKDGGLFVDGWRTESPDTHAAAFVHYTDGRTYAASYDQETGEITYFGPGPVHLALQVWARRFGPAIHVIPSAVPSPSSSAATHTTSFATAANAPSAEDQAQLRRVAASIWGEGLASGWDMNAEVGDILGTVTDEIMQCSAAFGLVPKPVGWVPGWSYVAKSAASIVAYVTGVSKDRVYRTCVVAAARNWRSAVELASSGF